MYNILMATDSHFINSVSLFREGESEARPYAVTHIWDFAINRISIIVGLTLCIILFYTTSFSFLQPSTLWIQQSFAWPPGSIIGYFALYGCIWFFSPYRTHHRLVRFCSSATLFLLYLHLQGPTELGDTWAREITESTTEIGKSSMLAIAFYAKSARIGLSQNLLSPIAGLFSAFLFSSIVHECTKDSEGNINVHYASLGNILYLGSGIHLLFLFGYREMTQLSIPALLLFFYVAIRYLRSEKSQRHTYYVFSAVCLAVAGLIHGSNTFLLPLIALLPILIHAPKKEWKRCGREILYGLLYYTLTILVVSGTLALFGYTIVAGDMYGGGDGRFFVSFGGPLVGFERYHALDMKHFLEISNMIITVAPLSVLLITCLCLPWEKISSTVKDHVTTLFVVGSMGYYALIFLHNIDLGFPTDLDLMMSMGTPLLILSIIFVMKCVQRQIAYIFACLSIALSWGFIGSYISATL